MEKDKGIHYPLLSGGAQQGLFAKGSSETLYFQHNVIGILKTLKFVDITEIGQPILFLSLSPGT